MIYASFSRRVTALAVDAAVLTLAVVAVVHASAWLGGPFLAIWETPAPVHTAVELVGVPSTVKHEGGREITTAFRRETEVFGDGNVRVYAVVASRTVEPDGAVGQR